MSARSRSWLNNILKNEGSTYAWNSVSGISKDITVIVGRCSANTNDTFAKTEPKRKVNGCFCKRNKADQSLAVEQGCAASIADGPVGEVEHMDDLMGQEADVPLLAEQLHTPLFGHTLYTVMEGMIREEKNIMNDWN